MNPKAAEKLGLTPYDSANYLQAVMAEDSQDPAYLARALGVVARARNMSQLARDTGLTREGLRKALAPGSLITSAPAGAARPCPRPAAGRAGA